MESNLKRPRLTELGAKPTQPSHPVVVTNHATDRRVSGQPFVRLSKEEKRILKYEHSKAARKQQYKVEHCLHFKLN